MTVSLLIQAAEATGGFYVFKIKHSIDKKYICPVYHKNQEID